MASDLGPGGLDLSALAAQAGAETQTRVNGGQSALAGFLASMLQEQQGLIQSSGEQQIREQNFARAQAILDDAMARRQAASSGSGSSGDGRDPALDMKMALLKMQYETDENIRQAATLGALDRRYAKQDAQAQAAAEVAAGRPRLSEFGRSEVNPYRGQAIQDRIREAPKGGAAWRKPITPAERQALSKVVDTYGLDDPVAVYKKAREIFGSKAGSAGRASLALWQLGYKPA